MAEFLSAEGMQLLPDKLSAVNNKLAFIVAVLTAYLLQELSSLVMPIVLAVFVGVLIEPIVGRMARRGIPLGLAIGVLVLLLCGLMYLVSMFITQTINQVLEQRDAFMQSFSAELDRIQAFLEKHYQPNFNLREYLSSELKLNETQWILKYTGFFLQAMVQVGETIGLASIYLVFLMSAILHYKRYLRYIGGGGVRGKRLIAQFRRVRSAVQTYILVKLLASLANGICFFITCTFFGVDFALFWGFLTFILYFIPNVGAVISSVLVGLMGFLQIDSFVHFFLFIFILAFFQFFTTNILEPKYLGDRLRLNTATVLTGLIVWGYLWGIIGIFLSVPLMVLIREILSQVPEYDVLVKLMSKQRS
ncbi:MAG: AI-2E family transporter [Cytophagales bacterium]|nr:AI-2E family transporter [Cytophagales bacterium]